VTEGRRIRIGVVGAGSCSQDVHTTARKVGRAIAEQGAVLLCGGLGGVMEAAAMGAKEAGGVTVGILPGDRAEDANPYIDLPIVTDMGHARNVILVRSSDAVIAVSGGFGTLSEIAITLKLGLPCVGIGTWDIHAGLVCREDPEEAVQYVLERIRERGVA